MWSSLVPAPNDGKVHAFIGPELAAIAHSPQDPVAANAGDFHVEETVVEQDGAPGLHILCEGGIRGGNLRAGRIGLRRKDHVLAGFENDRLRKAPDPNAGSVQIEQNGRAAMTAAGLDDLLEITNPAGADLGRAMRRVHPDHVHARI